MGEIINVDFSKGKKVPNNTKPENADNGIETILSLIKQLGHEKDNLKIEKYILILEQLQKMRTFLKNLQTHSSNETMMLRRDLISKMSLEEMCALVFNSNEIEWKSKPSYYKAVSDWFTPEKMTKILTSCVMALRP